MPADAIEAYKLGTLGHRDRQVTGVNVSDEVTAGGEKFTLRSLGGFVAHALGFAKTEEKPLESVRVAKIKKRGRLLESVDLEKMEGGLGSMQELDAALNKAKETR